MNFEIVVTPVFEKQAKPLVKKYASLKNDLKELIGNLTEQPQQGDGLGKDCYKIRLRIHSKSKGKSGGARVITCVKIVQNTVFLVGIYDKSVKNDLLPNELESILQEAGLV